MWRVRKIGSVGSDDGQPYYPCQLKTVNSIGRVFIADKQ